MLQNAEQIVTVAQMRSAEGALISRGISVDELMQRAGRGAGEWVWRIAAKRRVTVLCGPGNNGGDGYVIAETLRERGGAVCVVAASEPTTDAARNARSLYKGEVLGPGAAPLGEVLVDCLFGSGLSRPLSAEHIALLSRLAECHRQRIAIDVPSGVDSDSGAVLNEGVPHFVLTIALGALKFAHYLMPASATMGTLRLVGIGVDAVQSAATLIAAPKLAVPVADAHKYRRGLVAVVSGQMPGATVIACMAAQGSGAGYVKLLSDLPATGVPVDVVVDSAPLHESLADPRINALLVGPGLGRQSEARQRLMAVLAASIPAVIDADALMILTPVLLAKRRLPLVATPHEGELAELERAFRLPRQGSKPQRAPALAVATGMVIVAKGPDTVIAAPDGRVAVAPSATAWLSVAGSGDVLAGIVASRLAAGAEPFDAACEAVWLHSEAARLSPPAFTASQLAYAIPRAYAACL
jgi:ADP-dependent NAD(P)H-hydrate dehydratase / NAD(P)H-hydrate epimerase